MLKLPENKTRKKFRIAQCIFYLMEIFFCTFPFIQGADSQGKMYSYSVLDLVSYIGGTGEESFLNYVMYTPIIIIIPVVGFLFCAFDKQRNLKNLVSLICCAAGVISILLIAGAAFSFGALLSLLVYILVSFLTTIAMFARLQSDENNDSSKSSAT